MYPKRYNKVIPNSAENLGTLAIAKLYKREFANSGFIMVPGLEFITGRLGIKSSCFFAVAIKAPKKGTSLKQRSI
jgi:hypothetical protein